MLWLGSVKLGEGGGRASLLLLRPTFAVTTEQDIGPSGYAAPGHRVCIGLNHLAPVWEWVPVLPLPGVTFMDQVEFALIPGHICD